MHSQSFRPHIDTIRHQRSRSAVPLDFDSLDLAAHPSQSLPSMPNLSGNAGKGFDRIRIFQSFQPFPGYFSIGKRSSIQLLTRTDRTNQDVDRMRNAIQWCKAPWWVGLEAEVVETEPIDRLLEASTDAEQPRSACLESTAKGTMYFD
jgi:hypothetical protein